jgi:peptidoglycan/LPS O-acetylase OafA/YrhL
LALSHTSFILFYDPSLGVAIFFVLSGFVLAFSLSEHQPPWLALAVRRYIRLCLPALGITLLTWTALHLGAFKDVHAAAVVTKSTWLVQFYPPLAYRIPLSTFVHNCLFTFFTGTPGAVQIINGTLWTLPIELVGSLGLFAFYCLGSDIFRRSRGCFMVAAAGVLLTWNTEFYGFGLGVALFEIRRGISYFPEKYRRWLGRLAAPIGVIALVTGAWLGGTPYALAGWHLAFILKANGIGLPIGITEVQHAGAFLLVASVLLLKPAQLLLQTRVCQYLGKISFMLYLVQNPILCATPLWVFLRSGNDYNVQALAALATYLALSVLLADLATRLIDRPSIRLSRFATMEPRELWKRVKMIPDAAIWARQTRLGSLKWLNSPTERRSSSD